VSARTAAQVLRQALSSAGVSAAYGRPLSGLVVTEVSDPEIALLLAHAHRAVHGVPAIAHLGDGRIVVVGPRPELAAHAEGRSESWQLSLPAPEEVIERADQLCSLAPAVAAAVEGAGLCLHLDVDPSSVVGDQAMALPSNAADWPEPDPSLLADLSAARHVVVLAGPDVVRRGAVGGLRALAAAGRLGVLNTWGAKGVFHWRSRHHWATVGLQERDFELGGLEAADLVLTVGLDEAEAPRRLWAHYPHRTVAPELLAPLAERWGEPGPFPRLPPLRDRLATVTQAGWSATGSPLMPSRVILHYAQVLGNGGLVAADPGTAAFWVARTFATTRLGSASVPAEPIHGWAAACVLVARLVAPWRPALAVLDGPAEERTLAVLDQAQRLGITVGVEAWQATGEAVDAEAHLSRLAAMACAGGGVQTLATDDRQLEEMIGVAGPVRAWTSRE
jgi:Thiamine pyrophosphate enzyme, central domain